MKLVLKPKSPYDFNLHLKFFSFNKPCPELYENGTWKRALRLESKMLVPLKVRMLGDVKKSRLEVKAFEKMDEEKTQEIKNRLSWIFSTKEDLIKLYAFMDKDPILRKVKERLYGLKPFKYSTIFEGVIKSIIQQQISLVGSMYITSRLVERFGDKVQVGREEFYEFPSPESISNASTDELKRCGLSRQKAKYIKEFSEKVANKEFNPENLKKCRARKLLKY
jgi:DNA-3-methyladenine glycosylase II